LITTEKGDAQLFTIALEAKPTFDVVFNFSVSDSSEGIVFPTVLIFLMEEWYIPQAIAVTGVDDHIDDDDISYYLGTVVSSGDIRYHNIEVENLFLKNIDDEN